MSEMKTITGVSIIVALITIPILLYLSIQSGNKTLRSGEQRNAQKQENIRGEKKPELVVVKEPVSKLKHSPKIVRKRLEPESTKRLSVSPQQIRTVLITSGRAENAKWGVKGMASFVLTYYVDCKAEIIEKSENAIGEIKVVEKRTYTRSVQELELSDTDVGLSLYDTLPLDKLFMVVSAVGECLAYTGEPESMVVGETMKEVASIADSALRAVDGKSLRGTLQMFGVDMPKKVEQNILAFTQGKIKSMFKPDILEGKSYLITYFQDKESGVPLRVDFTYADGKPIETEEEWLVLRRANAFMDSNLLPDKNCSPGDVWAVDSSEFDCVLDPYVDGAYSGNVMIERKDDDKSGDWILAVRPGDVSIISDTGKTTGELHIESGEAKVDSDNAYVKAMVITGKGAMKNLTKHHLLFKSRFEGMCGFRGSVVTEPIR